jgi:hypothetical protein
MIQARIFRANQGILGHEEIESVVTKALAFVNQLEEGHLVQITQAAHSKFGANAVVVWYRVPPR